MAEAFHGMDMTISVGVGRRKKKFLDLEKVKSEIASILGSDAKVKELYITSDEEDEQGQGIDFLKEHLKCREKLDLPDGSDEKNYFIRADFLRGEFQKNIDYLQKTSGTI